MPKENGRFDIVTGSKRSGTSMMMYILKEAGIPVGGFKFPMRINSENEDTIIDAGREFSAFENDESYATLRSFNTNGYWEYPSVCGKGIQHKHKTYDGSVVKVFNEGLLLSEESLVGKVMFMMRNPKKVLHSSIKIGKLKNDPVLIDLQAIRMKKLWAETFRWLKGKDFRIIIYEELLLDPSHSIKEVIEWIGRGDARWGIKAVDTRMDRSDEIDHQSDSIDELYRYYELAVKRDVAGLHGEDIDELTSKINYLYARSLTDGEENT